jgi:hypothetical protein
MLKAFFAGNCRRPENDPLDTIVSSNMSFQILPCFLRLMSPKNI